jgi:hypothetical protein
MRACPWRAKACVAMPGKQNGIPSTGSGQPQAFEEGFDRFLGRGAPEHHCLIQRNTGGRTLREPANAHWRPGTPVKSLKLPGCRRRRRARYDRGHLTGLPAFQLRMDRRPPGAQPCLRLHRIDRICMRHSESRPARLATGHIDIDRFIAERLGTRGSIGLARKQCNHALFADRYVAPIERRRAGTKRQHRNGHGTGEQPGGPCRLETQGGSVGGHAKSIIERTRSTVRSGDMHRSCGAEPQQLKSRGSFTGSS